MRLIGSDPDIETLVLRIRSGLIDLRPNFQRGEVWSKAKKQRLVDSILRDWHVPPIHVVEVAESKTLEVLDGQQRLVAIRDFTSDVFPIDASIEPLDQKLMPLGGKFFSELPEDWKRQFNQFTIRQFRIVEYTPAEPGELFFRLNQPAILTGAEQRNAFFGPVREQVKELVAIFQKNKVEDYLGFKNTRMAYDDVVSRVGLAVDRRTIAEKITANDLVDLYRRDTPFSDTIFDSIAIAIEQLCAVGHKLAETKFNKATLFSWLLFLIRRRAEGGGLIDVDSLADFLHFFHVSAFNPNNVWSRILPAETMSNSAVPITLLGIYSNRSSSRVADVSSVLLRDAIIWMFFTAYTAAIYQDNKCPSSSTILEIVSRWRRPSEDSFLELLQINDWGRLLHVG